MSALPGMWQASRRAGSKELPGLHYPSGLSKSRTVCKPLPKCHATPPKWIQQHFLQNSMWPGSAFSVFPSPCRCVSHIIIKQSEASRSGPHPTSSPWGPIFPSYPCFKEESSLLLLETNASSWNAASVVTLLQQQYLLSPSLGTFLFASTFPLHILQIYNPLP